MHKKTTGVVGEIVAVGKYRTPTITKTQQIGSGNLWIGLHQRNDFRRNIW